MPTQITHRQTGAAVRREVLPDEGVGRAASDSHDRCHLLDGQHVGRIAGVRALSCRPHVRIPLRCVRRALSHTGVVGGSSGNDTRLVPITFRWRKLREAAAVPELAGRLYVPKLYKVAAERASVVSFLEDAVVASGGRVIHSSFRDECFAPIYNGAEDGTGARYGMLVYPFRATNRPIKNRPPDEHRAQIRLSDPARTREESNVIARDVAGVDVTLVLIVDPEVGIIIGLVPLVYDDLPMGISVDYCDRNVAGLNDQGWAVWERDKTTGSCRSRIVELETVVGFRPHRLLDYVPFDARASALGFNLALRGSLARELTSAAAGPHRLEGFFGLDSHEILDIIESNFRLGVAMRGGVAERHLERVLKAEPLLASVAAIDADGQPDFKVTTTSGRAILIKCSRQVARATRMVRSRSRPKRLGRRSPVHLRSVRGARCVLVLGDRPLGVPVSLDA